MKALCYCGRLILWAEMEVTNFGRKFGEKVDRSFSLNLKCFDNPNCNYLHTTKGPICITFLLQFYHRTSVKEFGASFRNVQVILALVQFLWHLLAHKSHYYNAFDSGECIFG